MVCHTDCPLPNRRELIGIQSHPRPHADQVDAASQGKPQALRLDGILRVVRNSAHNVMTGLSTESLSSPKTIPSFFKTSAIR